MRFCKRLYEILDWECWDVRSTTVAANVSDGGVERVPVLFIFQMLRIKILAEV